MVNCKRVTVCGAGFIGSHLVQEALAEGLEVSVLDHKPCPPALQRRVNWVCGEFTDRQVLARALEGAGIAYHLVSTTVPGDDHVEVIKELSDNIFGTIRFIETCAACRVQRIVFVSSASVYGQQETTPIPETAQTDPISSHGIHKLTIEKYLLLHRFNHDSDVRIIRLSNPYGPGQNLHGRQGFIAIAIGNVIDDQPILLRDAGSPIRDFIYISDVARALIRVGTAEAAPPVMNIGTGVGFSLGHVIAELSRILGRPLTTTSGHLRHGDIPTSVLDVALARRSVGFVPSTTLSEGLERTLRHHGLISSGDPAYTTG